MLTLHALFVMLDAVRKPILEEMSRFERARRKALLSDNALLALALDHIASRQGKMMRPMLTFLMARLISSVEQDSVLHAALSLELLHIASLIHDDVVDNSDRRRGQASVNALYGNRVAVLVGDYVLSEALGEASRTGSGAFVDGIARLGKALSDGELLQLHNMDEDVIAEAQYYDVIRSKTASLFATCAVAPMMIQQNCFDVEESGMIVKVDDVYRLGELIGMVFQMRDDVFDLTGGEVLGKPTGNDLHEGKLTLPVIHAAVSDAQLYTLALRVRKGTASDDDMVALAKAGRDVGVPYAEARMNEMVEEAHSIVDGLMVMNMPSVNDALHAYIQYTMTRNM